MSTSPISEEAIRKRAYELWKAQGERSNPTDDWNEAKRQLEQEQAQRVKGFRRITSLLNQPLILVEKRVFEPCADWFERAAIFQIIEKLSPIIEAIGVIMIPVAIWWFTETNEEVKERQEKATRGQQAVQSYLNQLSNILLQGGVEKLEKDEQLRNITRASTLALLQSPDLQNDSEEQQSFEEDRKGQVISYLLETKLIQSLKVKDKSKPPILSLQGANLRGADLMGANLTGVDLRGANLTGAYLSEANLRGANLEYANLTKANLTGANLTGAYLEYANLTKAYLFGANLTGADLSEANLRGVYLAEADLMRANLARASLTKANLTGADLTEANLFGANFFGANLTEADLMRANLTEAKLFRADLTVASLRGADLMRANLTEAKLFRADLTGADLMGANLTGANLAEAYLTGANYTDENTRPEACEKLFLKHPCATKFYSEFDPKVAGMVLVNNLSDLK